MNLKFLLYSLLFLALSNQAVIVVFPDARKLVPLLQDIDIDADLKLDICLLVGDSHKTPIDVSVDIAQACDNYLDNLKDTKYASGAKKAKHELAILENKVLSSRRLILENLLKPAPMAFETLESFTFFK